MIPFRATMRRALRSLLIPSSRHLEFVDESCINADGSLRSVESMQAEPRYVPALTADLPAVDSYRLAFGAEGEE